MVISRGFEPRTHSLEGCCSIQLSYETDTASRLPQKHDNLNAGAKLQKKNDTSKFPWQYLSQK